MKPYELPDSLSSSMTPLRLDELQAEAARYAVLRRLSPSLRHHLIRPLQPMTLIYGVMSHKRCFILNLRCTNSNTNLCT